MKLKKLLVFLTFFVFAALFAVSVSAADGSVYPVEKWYYQYEFNDDTLQGKDYFEGDAGNGDKWPFPVIETFDGVGVATFDTGNVAKNARIGFSLKKDTENYKDMMDAFENGEELCFEMKVHNDSTQKIQGYFFYNTLYLRNEGYVYFSNYTNEPGKDAYAANLTSSRNLQTGWHTISFVLYMDNGVVKGKNFEIDGKVIDKIYGMDASMDTSQELFLRTNASLFFVMKEDDAVNAKLYMDYLRIYTVKALKNVATDIEDSKKVSKATDKINIKFNYPLDSYSAQTDVNLLNPDGQEMDILTSVGSEEDVLLINVNEPFEYSNCYKIVIDGLKERDDKVKYSGEYEFYIENEPIYEIKNINLSQKTIDIKIAVPMDKKMYFSTLFFDSSGKLLDAGFSDGVSLSKEDANTYKTVDFLTKDVPSEAAKIKVFVFDDELNNVYLSYEQDI
ncbi:MAG: hypothetical protein IJC74_06885 [Clostridia bacterium]|nr:hypothetical protein [Clostridia bacterium]